MTKIAYLCTAYVGGTYTRFLVLRPILAQLGYDLRCVDLQQNGSSSLQVEILGDGVERWSLPNELKNCVILSHNKLLNEEYRAVFALPLGKLASMALVPYLPLDMPCITIVPGTTKTIYDFAKALSLYSDYVIAVSDRVGYYFGKNYEVSNSKLNVIFNGVDTSAFYPIERVQKCNGKKFRVLYLGRLVDGEKGVLMLPLIAREVARSGLAMDFDIAGSGPDLLKLKKNVERFRLAEHVQFLGQINHCDTPELLRKYDCFCLPSRIEACGFSLLEAMASGCVPVASNIWGSIGAIVEDGVSGFLASVGDINEFSNRIMTLGSDQKLLESMSRAAVKRVRNNFSIEAMAYAYANLVETSLSTKPNHRERLDIKNFNPPSVFKRRLRSYLPQNIKNTVRKWVNW